MAEKLIFDYSQRGKGGIELINLNINDVKLEECIDEELVRDNLNLPEVTEIDVIRHYTKLSRENFGVDIGFYPLGSCTMKYNPKINEDLASLEGFLNIHPLQPDDSIQGILEILYTFEKYLCSLFGYNKFTFQPVAGAHGELTGLMLIKAYHESRNEKSRNIILIPDSSHGTNPASASQVGYVTKTISSTKDGEINIEELEKNIDKNIAGLMLTNPNTLGLFDRNILKISDLIHKAGGLVYYDGANANATLGKARPGDLGFDIAHLNLHKTFSTPHGGGGPGAGPIGVKKHLTEFLPQPVIDKKDNSYKLIFNLEKNIGKVHSFYGNINVIIKAYIYLLGLGSKGLEKVSEIAVLNANYLKAKLKDYFNIPYDRVCQHEFVISLKEEKIKYGIKALDVAKRLIDYGIHPPTVYFPLIVQECLMIEPTETESKNTLDEFCDAMINIYREIRENPDVLKEAPHDTPVKRLDEVKAVKEPKLRWI